MCLFFHVDIHVLVLFALFFGPLPRSIAMPSIFIKYFSNTFVRYRAPKHYGTITEFK
ncbi:hypothetical protein BB560_006822, partial [Smittium megazygosporum]